MARSETVALPAGTWVQLTNADATEVTWQALGLYPVFIVATTDDTPPTSTSGSVMYLPGYGGSGSLADTWRGVASPVRLWAKCFGEGSALVSHA